MEQKLAILSEESLPMAEVLYVTQTPRRSNEGVELPKISHDLSQTLIGESRN